MTLPIVERLREGDAFLVAPSRQILDEAADTIEEIVETLRKARKLAYALEANGSTTNEIDALLAKIGGDA